MAKKIRFCKSIFYFIILIWSGARVGSMDSETKHVLQAFKTLEFCNISVKYARVQCNMIGNEVKVGSVGLKHACFQFLKPLWSS